MHENSLAIMKKFFDKYLTDVELNILDLGSMVVRGQQRYGSYKQFLTNSKWHYIGADIAKGDNVDLVLQDPYKFPLPDESQDVVISGQTLEHIEYPWIWVKEATRVLKNHGLICFIAPAVIHEHRYPIDTYRYYPDGMNALAKWCGLTVLEIGKSVIDRKMEDTYLFAQKIIEEKPIAEYEIVEMPDKETLQGFIKGMSGNGSVYFDSEKGKFINTGNVSNNTVSNSTTILYLTDNTVDEKLTPIVYRELLKASDGKRIVSVSQKPIDFGDNVCVGEIGRSWMSLYKQILAGLDAIDTKYVAIAEHDCLYTPEHYNFIPKRDDLFYYNHNCWLVQWGGNHPELNGMYSYWPKRYALSQLICNRELFKRSVEEIMGMLEQGLRVDRGLHWHGEPGVISSELETYVNAYHRAISGDSIQLQNYLQNYITKYNNEIFNTVNPNLDIRYGGNFTGAKRGKMRRYELPYWGKFENVIYK